MKTFFLGVVILALGAGLLFLRDIWEQVQKIMSKQLDLQVALGSVNASLDAIKTELDTHGNPASVMTQAELDAFVAQAEAIQVKAEALAAQVKTPPTPPAV
jgi:hypothetical protein